jgi:hypothetical protein
LAQPMRRQEDGDGKVEVVAVGDDEDDYNY